MNFHPDYHLPEARHAGEAHDILLAKLGEKLVYEKAFLRLYESFMNRRSNLGMRTHRAKSFEQRLFENFVAMKSTHYEIQKDALKRLGGDPELVVPSEDLSTIARLGIVSVFINPRASLGSLLHAVRIVELTGKSASLFLIRLALAADAEDLATRIEGLLEENEASLRLFPGRSLRSQKLLALHPES